jgi:hypothetical protein
MNIRYMIIPAFCLALAACEKQYDGHKVGHSEQHRGSGRTAGRSVPGTPNMDETVADVNNDGRNDLLTVSWYRSGRREKASIRVTSDYEGKHPKTLYTGKIEAARRGNAWFEDVDHDGDQDIVIGHRAGTQYWRRQRITLYNDGKGNFHKATRPRPLD